MSGQEIATAGVRTLVALTPDQMRESTSMLTEWCDRKLKEIADDRLEFGVQEDAAKGCGFDVSGIRRRLSKLKAKREFYEKVKEAVAAGYVIIPNFPISIFAIRTRKEYPVGHVRGEYRYGLSDLPQSTDLAPVGEGRYVAPFPKAETETFLETRGGKEVTIYDRTADTFKDVTFPVTLAKAQVIEATGDAMKKLIFDELGIVQDSPRGDPIVIGRIRDRSSRFGKEISFFVAWWLDLETL